MSRCVFRAVNAAICGGLIVASSVASAQETSFAPPPSAAESAAAADNEWWGHGVADLRFGQYTPSVDNGVSGAPFKTVFGSSFRAYVGIAFDWTPLRLGDVGVIGVGPMATYYRATANAVFVDGSGPSAETTSFNLSTLAAVASFRFEYLMHKTPIPLAFYGKLGPAVGWWWTDNGLGTSHANGKSGEGTTYGLFAGVGVALCLNMFDPSTAARFRLEHHVTGTYVFFEWSNYWLDNFGAANTMNVGASTWTTGISFQF